MQGMIYKCPTCYGNMNYIEHQIPGIPVEPWCPNIECSKATSLRGIQQAIKSLQEEVVRLREALKENK